MDLKDSDHIALKYVVVYSHSRPAKTRTCASCFVCQWPCPLDDLGKMPITNAFSLKRSRNPDVVVVALSPLSNFLSFQACEQCRLFFCDFEGIAVTAWMITNVNISFFQPISQLSSIPFTARSLCTSPSQALPISSIAFLLLHA